MAAKEEEDRSNLHRRLTILFLILPLLCRLPPPCAADDAGVMSDLAKSLNNAPPSWKAGTNPCGGGAGGGGGWAGVVCDPGGHVTDIKIAGLGVTGTLPPTLGQLSSLATLEIHQNQISGDLPSLSDLASLQYISIFSNAFSSVPPTFFSGLTGLQSAFMDNNPFAPWILPQDLGQCTGLTVFSASNSSITGSIPSYFGSMPNLQKLLLSYNNLSGGIPTSFAGSAIQALWLNNQQSGPRLSGDIGVVGSMAQLTLIWLQSNGFSGPIPDVSNLTMLASFNVRDNALTGLVPPSLLSCSTLTNVTLSNNDLQGPFPAFTAGGVSADVDKGNNFCNPSPGPCDPRVMVLLAVAGGFEYPKLLATSWKGNDPCANGWIGIGCDASQKSVTSLNLANQQLTGTISPAIANLASLTKLVLNNNYLTGPIPDTLVAIPQLQLLDVSNNNLSGMVPGFASNVVVRDSGNLLLGTNASSGGSPGSPGDGSPESSPNGSKTSKGSSRIAGVVIGIVAAIMVVIACAVCLFVYRKHRRQRRNFSDVQKLSLPPKSPMTKIDSSHNTIDGVATELHSHGSGDNHVNVIIEPQSMAISIDTLRQATNNFSEKNILGRGGFGVVYRGNLNGMLVAVKRNESDTMGKKGLAEFHAEIGVLTRVRHRHLVALLSYCIDGNERLLVYEYMPEGTLGDHLFDRSEGSRHPPLNWKQRLSIALDVARGVEYLHSLARESFIHRDLKPSNILLDRDMHAKVSDFGLVKLADNSDKSLMTKLAGTFGYLAPEYAITGRVSTKIDVYAYGVILMELITGRRAVDGSQPEEEAHLVTYFRRNAINNEKFTKSVDPALVLDEDDRSSLLRVAELACHCTHREPQCRPDMGHAVNILVPLVQQWKPSSSNNDNDAHLDAGMDLAQRLAKWQSGDSSSTTDFTIDSSTTMTSRTWRP